MDRDIITAMNISRKLSPRFRDSRGDIYETKSGNVGTQYTVGNPNSRYVKVELWR